MVGGGRRRIDGAVGIDAQGIPELVPEVVFDPRPPVDPQLQGLQIVQPDAEPSGFLSGGPGGPDQLLAGGECILVGLQDPPPPVHPHQVLRLRTPVLDELGDPGQLLQVFAGDHGGQGNREPQPRYRPSPFGNPVKGAAPAVAIIGFRYGAVQ